MNIENFEKRAQSELEGFRPEMDTDQIWQNIEPHLKKKKKRRLFILFFWGLGLFFLLLSLWKFNAPKNSLQAEAQASNPIPALARESKKPNENAPGQDHSIKAAANQSSELSSIAHLNASNTHFTYKQKGQKQTASGRNKKGAGTENTVQNSISGLQRSPSAIAATETVFTSDNQGIEPEKPLNPAPEIATATTVSADQDLASSLKSIEPLLESTLDENTKSIQQPADEKEKKDPAKKSPAKIKPHKQKETRQTLLLSSGAALPIKILKSNDRVEPNETLLAKRKASEKSQEALTADIRYAYTTRKGWMFLAGLNYKRLNEKFKVSYTEKETKTITGVLTQTVDAIGQVIAQTSGPKQVTTTRIYSNVAYNQYQYLNLPLGMGFMHWNKRSQWEVSGGFDLNLWFHFKGTHYDAYGTPVALGDPWYPGVYRRNAGLGMWASYGYSRNLSRNVRWQVAAKASVPFSNITSAEYALTQKYYTVGLQGGLIFNLVEEPKSKHKKRKQSESKW